MYENNIIFVGGIHGVGKTTFCQEISRNLSIEHFSSSQLISLFKPEAVRKEKDVHCIESNQDILLKAINNFLCKDKVYLLDGHFCLIDGKQHISEILIETFQLLAIKHIVILTANEEKILERLKIRDNVEYSLDFIRHFQQSEVNYGKYVSEKIKVPIKIIDNTSKDINIFSMSDLL